MSTISPLPEPDLFEPDLTRPRFGRLMGGVFRQWRRQMDLSFRDLGLSDATRMPLIVLHGQSAPMRQKDLAQSLYLDTSSLVRVLAQLKAANLLDWAADPCDRRTKCIVLTAEGRRMGARLIRRSRQIEQEILADLSDQELEATCAALEKISLRFDALAQP